MADDGARIDDARNQRAGSLPAGSSVGKYEIIRVLGSGGMGVLYEARHPVLANRLAIKMLHPAHAREGADRFRNEALAASRLRDDRLPQIFDIEQLDDGTLYIVMEYLEGEDLAQRLARGALDPGYASRLMFEVLELLTKVHTLGIVHRDLKPANIFIARSNLFGEIPKLLDFGVAHIASNSLTLAGHVLGTLAYMAPEQALDPGRIGPWTDVFAASIALYELIAGPGERPWAVESFAGHVAVLAGTQAPRPLTRVAPWTPPRLWEAIERGLQRDPGARYQDALDFARAIEPFAADRSILYKAASPATVVLAPAGTTELTSPATPPASAVEVPLVARKVAAVRDALAGLHSGASSGPGRGPLHDSLHPGERRLVVALCVQVLLRQANGPPLTEDDEEQLLGQFVELFEHELSQHGARVVAQPDNSLVAIFGDRRVQEDDAERAVAAALSIGRRRDQAGPLLADIGVVLTTRIGLNRGFLTRRGGADARLAYGGETIGLARRLAESAPINGVVATSDAIEGLHDWLVVQPFTRLVVPGRPRAVEVHELLASGPQVAAPGQAPLPFVGRDAELATLRGAFEASIANAGMPGVVAVTGGPGIGKTRLVGEFLARLNGELGDDRHVLRVQPPARVSYGLWGSLLDVLLARVRALEPGCRDADTAFTALAALLPGDRGELLRQQRTVVSGLIGRGVDELGGSGPREMGDRIQLAVTLCLEAASRFLGSPARPVIVVLENLHRADPASLVLIPAVVAAIDAASAPLLLLLTLRVALPGQSPAGTRLLELTPLGEGEAVVLARTFGEPALLSEPVQRLVTRRTGGNPLFIQQLVVALREDGLLGASEAQLRSVAPPVSLYGLYLERVDRLEPALGDALRLAAVLGTEFERGIYLAVSEHETAVAAPVPPRWTAPAALDELVARGFVAPLGDEDETYAFDQPQMQAAVYGTILTENRRILHARAAGATERFYEGRLGRHLARVLHHYSQSGNIGETLRYARLAGARALAIAAYDEAAEHLAIAVGLQDRVPGLTPLSAAETLHDLATALEWRGHLRQALTRAEEAMTRLSAGGERLDTAAADGRIERSARIAMTLADLQGLLGDWDRSIEYYAEAERRFSEAGRPVNAAEARCCRGFSHRARGQPEQGLELARQGWAVLETAGDQAAIARAGHGLGNLLRDLHRYDEALRIFEHAVASGDDLRRQGRMSASIWGSLAARSGRAMTYAAMGDMEPAIADQRAVIELARGDGNRVAEAISEYHLAAHYLEHSDLAAADDMAERAYRSCCEMDMPGRAMKCRLVQARLCSRAGDWERALERIRDAFATVGHGRVPDDALTTAVDLLLSAAGQVPPAMLSQACRIAWPHVSRSGGEALRDRARALSSMLGADDETMPGSGAALPAGDEDATRLSNRG
jgi:tetratricopeptide (TPR) repeat protein